ncbi:MAG: conjugal transfer protein TrbI [Brevundimonas sp.]|nr:MAG: conjugal transfer protein TrbI [Brevundimonas sp.]
MTSGSGRQREPGGADVRPVVARGGASTPMWVFVAVAVLAAILLFVVLDQRRREVAAPSTAPRSIDRVQTMSALPPLVLPYTPPPPPPPAPLAPVALTSTAAVPAPTGPAPGTVQPVRPMAPPQYTPRQPPPPPYAPPSGYAPQPGPPSLPQGGQSAGRVLVIDTAAPTETASDGSPRPDSATSEQAARREAIQSGRLGPRAMTVPEGTLIPAVLETALDSTRPGFARAIVSRDISGFDGSRVLIPRGSRLFGEYQADLAAGQNRVTVLWTRLVRPDGTTVALSSPAADTQGRVGVEGRVNHRFLERFAGALVQTTLDIGASLAGRSLRGDDSIIVTLPGITQTGAGASSQNRIQPTLRVDAGARVTVFVARDLEFSSGMGRRE